MRKRYRTRGTRADNDRRRHINVSIGPLDHPLLHVAQEDIPKVCREIGEVVEKEHSQLLTRLDQLIRACNPLQALAHFAFYDRSLERIQKGAEYKPVLQHSVEFFQAYFLTVPVSELNVRVTPPSVLLELNEVLRGLESTYPMLGFGKSDEATQDTRARSLVGQQVRIHTHGVRNAGYYPQVIAQLHGIFSKLDADFEALRGVKLSALVTMMERILVAIQERVRTQLKVAFGVTKRDTPREVIDAYCDARALSSETREGMLRQCEEDRLGVQEARFMCANHAELALLGLYTLDLSDFVAAYPEPVDSASLHSILIDWSYWPEGLVGYERKHLFLSNPIWHKPLIRVGAEKFLWPMVELSHSFGLEMLEGLVRSDAGLWDRYQERARAHYLEEHVYELCQHAFPCAKVFRGSVWLDPEEGIKGENDILVLIDAVALVIECKSGRITPEGRRGLPDRLRKEVKKLIEEAAKQSARFSKLLLRSTEILRFSTLRGVVNEVDASNIKRVVRLNVTLDYFGPLACAVRDLVDAKLIDAAVATAPTLAVVDFENVLHLLESPLERLHYLARRADVERNISLFAGEEDLLACYLATGLNLGTLEELQNGRVHLGRMHKSIQPYFMAYYLQNSLTKPKRRFTTWWLQILEVAVYGVQKLDANRIRFSRHALRGPSRV